MRSIRDLRLLAVWLSPDHMVATALHVMRGHNLASIGVTEGDKFVGVVAAESLLRAPEAESIARWVESPAMSVEAGTDIKKAAGQFIREDVFVAPVLDGDRFVGMLTSNMLLEELGRSWDPLTNLPWSDQLREWGLERLAEGKEIAILFLDIDDFGNYNKKFGHIVGDQILQAIAGRLGQFVTGEWDVLVRFGGDEFALGLVSDREHAEKVKAEIERTLSDVSLDSVPRPVSTSVGLSGGKRTKERESIHLAATVNSLINLASKDCMTAKRRKATTVSNGGLISGVSSVLEVAVDQDGGPTIVLINLDGESLAASYLGKGAATIEAVAKATAEAISRGRLGDHVEIDDVVMTETPTARAVTIAGRILREGRSIPFVGTKTVGNDLYFTTAEATLEGYASRARQHRS